MFKGISRDIEIWGKVKDELNKIYVLNKILSKLDFFQKYANPCYIGHS